MIIWHEGFMSKWKKINIPNIVNNFLLETILFKTIFFENFKNSTNNIISVEVAKILQFKN